MNSIGIIGASGFVGGYLSNQYPKVSRFGRNNITDLYNDESDFYIIAAAPGEKWKANNNPQLDLENMQDLIHSLSVIREKKCVLISTIDVFPVGVEFNEDSIVPEHHPESYGANRGYLERELSTRFNRLQIVRLPGLFGPGLKKNLLYDLLMKKNAPNLNPKSTFQYYDIRNLPGHLTMIENIDSKVFNLACEPIQVSDVYNHCFGRTAPQSNGPILDYKMKTNYSYPLSGKEFDYLMNREEVLRSIKNWVASELSK
jgi:nucleoside-diphosphate-sugar epimerase